MMKLKNTLNNKALAAKQTKFIHTLEGIGDVLVFETKRRNRNKNVIQGLKRISNITKTFFDIKRRDADKFERLVLAQEFFDLYRKNDKEAKLRLAFDPGKYLISFSTLVNQIIRVHEAALAANNVEISRFATYHLNGLLADITRSPNNELFVEQLLKNLAEMARLAVERQDRSMYAALIHWYTHIVFKIPGEVDDFDISYLELFNKYFFSSVKYIISQNQTSLFEVLISSLVDGIHIPYNNRGKIWEYGHLILETNLKKYNELDKELNINDRIQSLTNFIKDLDTREKRNEWLKKFEELKKIIEKHLDENQYQNAQKIEKEIREFVDSQFKYSNLLEIVFAIGSFCLFKQKPEHIKYIWEYKQPPDSDASWIGHDIVPKSINEVVNFYFRKSLFERKFDFWEGHHGNEVYYKKYFLLLLTRVLQNIKANHEGKYKQTENYNLPELHIYRLNDLENSVDNLVELAKDLKKQEMTLNLLGFNKPDLDELFNKKLIPFLGILKLKAQTRIRELQRDQQISQIKVDKFKGEALKGFSDSVIIRDIFKHFKLFQDKSDEKYDGDLDRFGINRVDDKAAFFDEWHVHYLNWGTDYGKSLALSENSFLIKKIAERCREIKNRDFEEILEQFDDPKKIIAIAINVASYIYFKNSKNFKSKWYRDTSQIKINGFEGWYSFKGSDIPIFEIYNKNVDKEIIFLNKDKLGTLTQYPPLDAGEDELLKKDMFYMNVQSFSEDRKLMDRFIKTPPEWLKKIGNTEKQKEYLQERVLIHIFERFEYNKPSKFEGFLLKLKD